MNVFFRWNLWRAKQILAPRPAFRRTLKSRLMTAWEGKYGVVKQPFFARYAGAFATGIAIVFMSSTGAYAYTSPEVTEGTVLYPVKRAIETVEEKIKTTPEAKAAFYLKQIDRREAEEKVLTRRQKRVEKIEAEIEKNEASLAEVEQKIATSTSPELKAKAQKRLEKRKEQLERRREILERQEEKLQRPETNEVRQEQELESERQRGVKGFKERKNKNKKTDH